MGTPRETLRSGLGLLLLGVAAVCATACDSDSPGVCGDGTCSPGETTDACELDCPATGPYCGDGACNSGETSDTCAADCASGGPICGDGVCNGAESSASCPDDCPAGVCTWTAPETCLGDTLCVNQSCVPAYGRVYSLSVVRAEISQFMFDGSTWDAAGGAPDPFCVLTLNGQLLLTTSAPADTFTPVWNEGATTMLAAGSELNVECWDEDVASDDRVLGCTFALSADVLHVRDYRCTEDGSWVELSFLTN